MNPPVISLYAACLSFVFLALTVRVILYRRQQMISVGDKGDKALLKRMRAQANFIEFVPLTLIILILLEAQRAPVFVLHILGFALLVARASHAVGFSATPQKVNLRILGIALNSVVLIASSVLLLGLTLF